MIKQLIIFAILMYVPLAVKLSSYLFYKPIAPIRPYVARADIVDSSGILLATTIPTQSVYIIPYEVLRSKKMIEDLAVILNVKNSYIEARLNSKSKKFVWVLRHIAPWQATEISKLNYSGVYIAKDIRRFYPLGSLFAHIIGKVDDMNNGISGVEIAFDKQLKEKKQALKLSLMSSVQFVLKDVLDTAKREFSAKSVYGMIICAKTGRILASYSQSEDFDVNPHESAHEAVNFNTQSVDERGSIFKVMAAAMLLEQHIVDLQTKITAPPYLRLGKFIVRDYDKRMHECVYTYEQAFSKSSNIVHGMLVLKAGAAKQVEFLKRVGIFDQMKIDNLVVARGLYPKQWSNSACVTASYGHGLAVTSAQYLRAFLRVITGYDKELHILENFEAAAEKRVLDEETVRKMRYLMALVFKNSWYSKNINMDGYDIGGKTGTANKLVHGKYIEKHNLCNYVFVFPAHDPQIIGIVSIDEPHATKETYGFVLSSFIAAPLGIKIIKKIGPILSMDGNKKGIAG